MTRVNDSCCELKSVFLTTESGQICQLTRIIKSPIPESESALTMMKNEENDRKFGNSDSDSDFGAEERSFNFKRT